MLNLDSIRDRLRASRLRQAAEQQQLQADQAARNLEEQAALREKLQAERQKELKEKMKAKARGASSGKSKPILAPPSPINMENPIASMGQGMDMEQPQATNNFGQPGGPQPGAPQQGGGGFPMGVPPFITRQATTREVSLQPTGAGTSAFLPSTRTTTTTEPNVLSAYEAGRLQMSLMQTRQKSQEAYLDDVAKMAVYAENDPVIRQVAIANIRQIAEQAPELISELDRRIGVVRASREEFAEKNPKALYDPNSPTERTFGAGGFRAIGQPAPGSIGAEIGSALQAAIGGLSQILRPDEVGKIHEETRQAGNMLASLLSMRNQYDPRFLEIPSKVLMSVGVAMDKLGMDAVPPDQLDLIQRFSRFRATVQDGLANYRRAMTGMAANQAEMRSIEKIMPNENDSPRQFIGKWEAMIYANVMLIARNTHFLQNGLMGEDSVAAALLRDPKYTFEFNPGGFSQGEMEMLKLAAQKETEFAMQLRESMRKSPGPMNDAWIKEEAQRQAAKYFGLPVEAYNKYLREQE